MWIDNTAEKRGELDHSHHRVLKMRLTIALTECGLRLPPSSRYEGELVVEYDSGERTYVALSASAGGVDVCLSTPSLQLEPAYIGLCSQKTLKIVNRSEIPVKFSWEAFATSEEEEVRTLATHASVYLLP